MGPDAARPVRPGKTIAKAAENARDGRHEKRPAIRPILISGENGFRRPISEERLRPVTKRLALSGFGEQCHEAGILDGFG